MNMANFKFLLFFTFTIIVSISISECQNLNSETPKIDGDTNLDLFKKYRCRVCDDIMIDNIELVDGELVLNEKLAIKICETFFSKVLHNSFGGIICHTVVQSLLDKVVKQIVNSGSEARVGEQICKAIRFCE